MSDMITNSYKHPVPDLGLLSAESIYQPTNAYHGIRKLLLEI